MPRPDHRIRQHVVRDPKDVSPKVSYPAGLLAVAAVVSAIVNGEVIDPVQVTLAVAAIVTFVTGYFKSDELSPS